MTALREYLNDPALDEMGDCEKTAADNSVVPKVHFLYALYRSVYLSVTHLNTICQQ